jgi:Cu(I)-responsive transcriptional regulator
VNIGQAAAASGVSAKMIRHYEAIGLIPPAGRRDSNYRDYAKEDVERLRFVRRARDLGFSVERIRELLALWSDRSRSNADVRALAQRHVAELEAHAAKLQAMIGTLRHLMRSCHGAGERTDCPILEELGDHRPAPPMPVAVQRRRAAQR